ncbi:MAG: class I SAM-dependent DNA methyltransferase [Candidatus Competibacter sp.]|nr:class I SAM-dependent DNA methyltransferase [Candidatus Competibacter sp.]
MRRNNTNTANATAANLGYEARLWQMADALRNNMDAAEYKHVVLGLIFLKYISDAFEAKHAELDAERDQGADPEDPDEYRAASIFWVPKEARWSYLKASAPQPTIGTIVDDAMAAIERDNPTLKGVLPKDFGRAGLDKQRLGQIINLVSDISFHPSPPGRGAGGEGSGMGVDRAKDTLGRVYEYFLARFASAEGKSGGQFYTPSHVVRVLVEMLAPYKGRVYDPCCGSGGMFVQSEKFIEAHAGKLGDISIYGQESNYTTWRLAKMNLAIRGIDAQIAHGDTFHKHAHPDLKADYVLANPPFNDSDWRGELLRDDKRWVYGVPPAGNANYAWVQHFIHHLAPTGLAGFVLANGSMSSNQSGEGEIRKAIIEADLVDCMVALPGQLFYSTQIPVCLWFLRRDKRRLPSPPGRGASSSLPLSQGEGRGEGANLPSPLGRGASSSLPLPRGEGRGEGGIIDRRGETLFIDARKLGTMADRVHRELTDADIAKIAGTYHAWRGDPHPKSLSRGERDFLPSPSGRGAGGEGSFLPSPSGRGAGGEGMAYQDIPGFCKSATLDDIRKHGHVLTPGRYVGAEAAEDDGEPFEEKMKRLAATLREQQAEAAKLDAAIAANLKELGYGG